MTSLLFYAKLLCIKNNADKIPYSSFEPFLLWEHSCWFALESLYPSKTGDHSNLFFWSPLKACWSGVLQFSGDCSLNGAKVAMGCFSAEQPEGFGTSWSEEVNGLGVWVSAAAWTWPSTESLVKIGLVAFQKLPKLILYISRTVFYSLFLLLQPPKPSVCKGSKQITLQVIFSIRMIRLNELSLAKL